MYCAEEELPAAGAALLRRGGGSTRLPSRGCEDEDVLLCCAVVRCDAARPNPPRQLPAPLPGRPGDAGFGDRGAAPRVVGSVEPPRFCCCASSISSIAATTFGPMVSRARFATIREHPVAEDTSSMSASLIPPMNGVAVLKPPPPPALLLRLPADVAEVGETGIEGRWLCRHDAGSCSPAADAPLDS